MHSVGVFLLLRDGVQRTYVHLKGGRGGSRERMKMDMGGQKRREKDGRPFNYHARYYVCLRTLDWVRT